MSGRRNLEDDRYKDYYIRDSDDKAAEARYYYDSDSAANGSQVSSSDSRFFRDDASSVSLSVPSSGSSSAEAVDGSRSGGHGEGPPPQPRRRKEPAQQTEGDQNASAAGGVRNKRLGRSQYVATEIHGFYGLVDTNQVVEGNRILTAHIPKRSSAYSFDLRPGDLIYANSTLAHQWGRTAALAVSFITPHQYFPPGRKITSYNIGVPDEQWRLFMGDTG